MSSDKPIVVISGMSGRFPGVNSVADYAESLYNKVNLVGPTKGRYPTDGLFEELPDAIGRVEDFEKFDFNFFNIKPELAKIMDPQAKKMLEVTVEAILDAGLTLEDVKGSRTGAFYGHLYADLDRTMKSSDFVERLNKCSDPSIAFHRQMYHEWVAFCLDLTGPTYHYESACSSSMYSFSDAFKALESGLLDTALVITTNLNLVPNFAIQYLRLGIMSRTGVCRFADANADGYIKSEAVCCLVLQRYDPKLSNVKRIYSRIVNTKCNSDGFKEQGITFPKTETQYNLIKETFEEVGLHPTQVNYVESHGTGTQTGDIQELNCIDMIFNDEINYSKRKSPLYVGSVKSNIGHAESSSGLCSIIKSVFCFMYDKIPPVINYSKPNPEVPALLNGKIKIPVEAIPLNTDLISVSSFGFGGSNTHVILQNSKSIAFIKDNHLSSRSLNCLEGYQLVNLAARSEQGLIDGLHKLAHQFRSYDINLNEIYLLNDVMYREQVKLGFNYTGHMVLNLKNLDDEPKIHVNNEPVNTKNIIDYHKSTEQPLNNKNKLFFAFPGLGCQWDGMSVPLLDLPFFAKRMKELCEIIQPNLEFDIYKLMLGQLENNDQFDFNDSIFCLIAVAIYQISFLDLLNEIGIKPDGYFGHSFGELICAYCDNICTAKQVLEATVVVCNLKQRYDECDKQNKPINNFLFEKGKMAIVGLSWEETLEEIKKSNVQKVNAACNNSIDCATVSGADKEIEEFLIYLNKKGIFNRKIASCGMAFHCDLVKDFYDYLLKEFNKIFKDQVKRKNKWISTSINPFSEENISWLNDDQLSSRKEKMTFAQYFANCILKPVLFKESCEKMVFDLEQSNENIKQVFIMEVAPRSFLTSLIKKNTSKYSGSLTCLPGFSVIKKENLHKKPNTNLITLLDMIGILNDNGIYSSLSKLYEQQSSKQSSNENNDKKTILTNGLTNGHTNNDHINKKQKTKSSTEIKLTTNSQNQPIITNHLSLSSLIQWDQSVDQPVPAYPEFFNNSIDENKIDLNSLDFKNYLPDKTSHFRLPLSFYLDSIVNKFKNKNKDVKFTTVHFQDLMIYRLDEMNVEELENLSIELLEYYEQSTYGQVYIFLIKNRDNKLILSGNFAISTQKINYQSNELSSSTTKQLSNDKFYEQLNLLDSRNHLIKNKLSISSDQITTKLNSKQWTNQLDSLLQLFNYFNKKSFVDISETPLQIHSINIQLDQNEKLTDDSIIYDNQTKMAQSNQIELKCIQLNDLNKNLNSKLIIDQNNNFEFKHKQRILNEMNNKKLSVKYFNTRLPNNLNFIGFNEQNQLIIGLLDRDDRFKQTNCWTLDKSDNELSYLSLFNGYLIASDLLSNKCKLNYNIESAFLNCEQNLDFLIALCDQLDNDCSIYLLINDQIKSEFLRKAFSSRKNLHILSSKNSTDYDFDLDLLRLTNGEGTQLVVSESTNKHEFNKSLNCLSLNGKFIHLNNEATSVQNLPLGMALFLKNIDFLGLTLDELNLEEITNDKHEKINSILKSINPSILNQLKQLNQFELEKLFKTNIVHNHN